MEIRQVEKRRRSITRLKRTPGRAWQDLGEVEKRRRSITRLKHYSSPPKHLEMSEVEKRRRSITRLKLYACSGDVSGGAVLKREDARLRDKT